MSGQDDKNRQAEEEGQDPNLETGGEGLELSDEEIWAQEAERRESERRGLFDEGRESGQRAASAEAGEEGAGDEGAGGEGEEGEEGAGDEGAGGEGEGQAAAGGEQAPRQQAPGPHTRPDWWDKLPAEAQQAFDHAQQQLETVNRNYAALHGRLAPIQQQNDRLARQLEQLQDQRNAGGDSGQGSQSKRGSTAAPAGEDLAQSEDFAEFAKAFPDEARAIEALVQAKTNQVETLVARVNEMSQQLQSLQDTTLEQTRQTELERLQGAHPDWQDVRFSPAFENWLQYQPKAVREMATSPRADDCIWLLDSYKTAVYLTEAIPPQQGNGTGAPAAPPAQPRRAADTTQARRQGVRRVASPDPQGGRVGVPRNAPALSDEELWAQEAERRMRQRSQQ